MSGDFVAQWGSLIWAALDGHRELDFNVSSLVWRLGAEHGASFCGDATNVMLWQARVGLTASRSVVCTLCAEVLPPLPCASAAAAIALGWAGPGSQTRGQLNAFLVESLSWLLTSLNFLTVELNKCLCWRWPGKEGWQDQPPVVLNCFQNHALVENTTKGSVFKRCLSFTVYCVYI